MYPFEIVQAKQGGVLVGRACQRILLCIGIRIWCRTGAELMQLDFHSLFFILNDLLKFSFTFSGRDASGIL